MQLSLALKTTRQKAFMTQEAFAKELGVTASTINRWEHGKANDFRQTWRKSNRVFIKTL